LQEQITLAFQADVVMGVHGAALAHAVFAPRGVLTLELKTLYGYGSTVFARISDARVGLHAQVGPYLGPYISPLSRPLSKPTRPRGLARAGAPR
jgi:hypothetical protein